MSDISEINVEIFETDAGSVEVKVHNESVWLTQSQMAELFATSTDNVGLHLKNIFIDEELLENSSTEDFSVVRQEGRRKVRRTLKHYNLDAIISVGYRVNSKRGVRFRQWATKLLKEHLIKGYTIDHARFESNAQELEAALKLVQKSIQSPELTLSSSKGIVDIISKYTHTFLWLQRYDEGLLTEPQGTEGGALPLPNEAQLALEELKTDLISKQQATNLFAQPRGDGLGSIFGNLEQTVFGEPAYPSLESKAAHLLYFVVKNHPFSDGNKRSAAFLFVDFLHRNNRLYNDDGSSVINDAGLAALTLLVAESDPKQKDVMVRLIINMLAPA
ncbi:virulence RhuM family protein [Shewanella olleyana]|uniref:virulence protein RhuM/Fic/DOC family protein n=1 Tax=Shewanella olleyana TaxID=135626 RepID=UPI00200CF205|nr:virulence protein RhuM/Fic/DOC family protein [Shewanella olleyana]MCL1065705.1 virulence RhuM family protein [Shewanella olleyana]